MVKRRWTEEARSRVVNSDDSSADAVIVQTLDGTITSWNRGAERLYGYTAAEILGRSIAVLAPADRRDETLGLLTRLARGERTESLETVRLRRDGRPVNVSLSVTPVHDAAGAVVGASTSVRDITRRKRAEERLSGLFAVTRVLADAATLAEAAPRLLQAIGQGFGWERGELWRTSPPGARLTGLWPTSNSDHGYGEELVQRALVSKGPIWVEDLEAETVAEHDESWSGLRAALAWPIVLSGDVAVVLVFQSHERRAPRQELLDQMGDIGARIGQFLERERAVEGLRRLEKAVETIELGVTITDVNGRILYTNPAEAAMHGRRTQDLIGQHVSTFMPAGWTVADGRPSEIRSWKRETLNVRSDGSVFPVQLVSDAVRDPDGTPVAVVTCSEEITERKRAEAALRTSEERYRLLFERNLAGVYRARLDGRLLDCNDAVARILGYASREEVLALTLFDLSHSRQERAASLAQLRRHGSRSNVELRLRRKGGDSAWVLENQTLVTDADGVELVQATFVDITDRKEFERRVEFQALHDPLTGLPNRGLLEKRLDALLSEPEPASAFAVVFVDLDHFKSVNDTLGHATGDRLLQQAASRLRECVREDDLVTRVGGDEFVLLLPHVRKAGSGRIARQILQRMRDPFRIDEHELKVTASLGIALSPDHGDVAETLLQSADAAMYSAKDAGRDNFKFSGRGPRPASASHGDAESRVRRAFASQEMALLYRPLIALGTVRAVGGDAVLRWRHPEHGILPPEEIHARLEESGLADAVAEHALREACRTARDWQDKGLPLLRVAVAVSPRQLLDPALADGVGAIVAASGLSPSRLELVISENAVMQDVELVLPAVQGLARRGIAIALGDFGVGRSCLSLLDKLPVAGLRLDRALIPGLGGAPRGGEVLGGIVGMAHGLGLSVLAQGIASEAQLATLQRLGCDEGQGSFFGEAVPAEELAAALAHPERSRA
jgi:diguanylate cyclase (GGDEF)-like protein/PAS domain S-box-containing protein